MPFSSDITLGRRRDNIAPATRTSCFRGADVPQAAEEYVDTAVLICFVRQSQITIVQLPYTYARSNYKQVNRQKENQERIHAPSTAVSDSERLRRCSRTYIRNRHGTQLWKRI